MQASSEERDQKPLRKERHQERHLFPENDRYCRQSARRLKDELCR